MSHELYEINWDTGACRNVTSEVQAKIDYLYRQIDDLNNKMQRGWWIEPAIDPGLTASDLTGEAFHVETRQVRCTVVREVL